MKLPPDYSRLREHLWWIDGACFCYFQPDKTPHGRDRRRLSGSYADPAMRAKLMTLDEAVGSYAANGFAGVGLVFTPDCGIVGLDLDHVWDTANRKWAGSPEQYAALQAFQRCGAYIERSMSGEGIHALVPGTAETKRVAGVIEIFGNKNYIALTGRGKVSARPVAEGGTPHA